MQQRRMRCAKDSPINESIFSIVHIQMSKIATMAIYIKKKTT